MGKNKKERSVIPTYIFGASWLLCALFTDWGIIKCFLVAFAVRWFTKKLLEHQKEKKEKKQQQKAAAAQKKAPEKPVEQSATKPENPELDSLIREGRASVEQIRELNDDIPDYKVSAQLKQIEILTASMLDQVERKPEKIKEVRQVINYYLPTTVKLLEQYVQFQNVGMKGENIDAGMKQIETMLDKVIVAFQKQLDGLFERDVVDITADIQVMEQMMEAQGLTNKRDF